MQDLIASLVAFFLIDPLQAEMRERLDAARVPQAVVAEVTACARRAVPAMMARATDDPGWAVSNAVGLWLGWARADEVLVATAPDCAPAVAAARPYLGGASS